MDADKLAQMTKDLFAAKGIKLTPEELQEHIAEFMATANVLNLRDNDEAFSFLILCAAHNALYKKEINRLGKATGQAVAGLQEAFEKIIEHAETAARTATLEIESNYKKKSCAKALVCWICGGILVLSLVIAGSCWFAFVQGKYVGLQLLDKM